VFASKSCALNFDHLRWQFTRCTTRRTLSIHTAPQLCGSCREHRHTDRLGRFSFSPSYIPRTTPGSCHM
jgi:hypothetical protein